MSADPEAKRLRKLSPAALADEAGALKARSEAIGGAAGQSQDHKERGVDDFSKCITRGFVGEKIGRKPRRTRSSPSPSRCS
jgi:hypothetical protein